MSTRTFPVAVPAGAPAATVEHALATTVLIIIRGAWLKVSKDCSDTGDYRARLLSQDALRYPLAGDPDAAAVVNTSDHAWFVDMGHAAFHLPSRWGSGHGRWRVGKNGNEYAFVAFRTATPPKAGEKVTSAWRRNAMPEAIHAVASQMGPGDRLSSPFYGQGKSYTSMRQTVERWSEMFADAAMADLAGYDWAATKYEGLFNAGDSTTPGGGTQSNYITIRTITPTSPGWVIPGVEGKHYDEKALDLASAAIASVLDKAAAADIEIALLHAAEGL